MGRLGKGGAGDLRRAEPVVGAGVTLVELKVARCELAERIEQLKENEQKFAGMGRWNLRRETKDQRHRKELLLAEVDRRIAAMEASS